jgi:hypothetical protein
MLTFQDGDSETSKTERACEGQVYFVDIQMYDATAEGEMKDYLKCTLHLKSLVVRHREQGI